MISKSRHHMRAYLTDLAARGRYSFTSEDAREVLGVSADAVKLALNRLSKQGAVASPARGFYVIVPPEYRTLGSLPAEQFIPALMERLGHSYYAGLLSAAQFHGAAHHRPQEFQVMLRQSRRPIRCGQVRVAFIVNRRVDETPVQSFNTPRGAILVSTPEATAVDLVAYHEHA
ncbi:MAG: type IV toxin-antitoxin system AbiEi family antitoxin, partial [Hyphomonadaceae bacterium]|nr:type IV toxin-antitoxin system AbiEi family antitoxin [Hyphomonadaceae bacterium]